MLRSLCLSLALVFAVAAPLSGCAPRTTTAVDQSAATALRSVTASRAISTQLLVAGKISSAKDRETQLRLDGLRDAIVAGLAANNAAQVKNNQDEAEKIGVELKKVQ